MKTKILVLSAILLISASLANASVTVRESTSAQDLKNYGFSDNTIEATYLYKCSTVGEKCLSNDEIKYGNSAKPVKWIRKFFIYVDPTLDADPPMLHNIKNTPSVNDL